MEAQQQTEAPAQINSRQALTSSASDDWGSPELLRRFAACVLKPAAHGDSSIDFDATSSPYWQEQWAPEDRPRDYFDGSAGRDVFCAADWERVLGGMWPSNHIGSVFDNPPGDPTGGNVQEVFYTLSKLHAARRIGSVFWVGFSLEQLRSLIPHDADRPTDPLHPLDKRCATVFPSSRIAYMAHPNTMIALYVKRLAKQSHGSPEHKRLTKAIDVMIRRSDDSPVRGPAPTHSSYLTILWHWEAKIRREQKAKARAFLRAQAELTKSALRHAAVIGDIDP